MGEIARQRQVTQKCAANAANYVHPKLANISPRARSRPPADHLGRGASERGACASKAGSTCIEQPLDELRRDRNALGHRLEIQLWG
jgi:hypothetical protein